MIFLSTAYLPNIQYFTKLLSGQSVAVEACEHFQKQSFRNRCQVLGSQGILNLTVPVIWDNHTLIRDVRIDHRAPWQRIHLRTIRSIYGAAPYWEHLVDRMMPLLEHKHDFLFDHNMVLTEGLLRMLGHLGPMPLLTQQYVHEAQPEDLDFRSTISPKARLHRDDPDFSAPEYFQVFSDRMPFVPNLSIIDMMFCDLPGARQLVKR